MVAANDDDVGHRANAIDHSVRIGAIANEIAEEQNPLEAYVGGRREHRLECLEIGVDVTQHEITHAVLR